MSGNLLCVLAKHWQPGEVQTRLAATVGHATAARLHREFLLATLRRLAATAERRVLWFSPSDRAEEFARLLSELPAGNTWQLAAQPPGDLGQRMAHAFQQGFDSGQQRIVLVGADSPTLPVEFVRQAFAELDRQEVVLGPSDDGGYYLIGLSRTVLRSELTGPLPPIFADMLWSTPQVCQETTSRLDRAGRSYHLLPRWYDVDEPQSLARLHQELAAADEPALLQLRLKMIEIARRQS